MQSRTLGRDKFDSRWREGVWPGVRLESGEPIIGTADGVVKAKDFRRKVILKDRWDKEMFSRFKGVPWEPVPGRSGEIELKCKVSLPMLEEAITKSVQVRDEHMPRRFRIKKSDLERYGYTIGCPGCRAANRGLVAVGHTEECRRRIEDELSKLGDERILEQRARFKEYEGEIKKEEIRRGKSINLEDVQKRTGREVH